MCGGHHRAARLGCVRDSQLGADSPVLAFTTARWQTILTGARAGKPLARPTAAQKTRPGADTRPGPDLPPKELTTSTNALACRRTGRGSGIPSRRRLRHLYLVGSFEPYCVPSPRP
jgi:hypothetical protein